MAENIDEDGAGGGAIGGGTTSSVPINSMGQSGSTAGTGGIDTYDPLLLKSKHSRANHLRNSPGFLFLFPDRWKDSWLVIRE